MKKLVIKKPTTTTEPKQPTLRGQTKDTYLRWVGWPVWLAVSYGLALLATSAAFEIIARVNAEFNIVAPITVMAFRIVVYVVLTLLFIYVPLMMIDRETISSKEMGIGRELRWRDILYGIAGFIAYGIMTMVVMLLASNIPWLNTSQPQELGFTTSYGLDRMAAFVLLVMITPFFEEWIFRGALQGKLRAAKMPWWLTALVVSVLFGAAHGQWNVALSAFCLGIVASWLREKTGTIWPGLIVHILKNLIAFVAVFLFSGGVS